MLCNFFGLSFPKYAACLIDAEKKAYADFDSRPFSSNKDGAIEMTVVLMFRPRSLHNFFADSQCANASQILIFTRVTIYVYIYIYIY